MCLIVYKQNNPDLKPLVAESDIVCWKVIVWYLPSVSERLRGGVQVPVAIYMKSYLYGRTNTANRFASFVEKNKTGLKVYSGIHAFCDYKDAIHELDIWCNPSYKHDNVTYEIIECVIPRGVRYYEGFVYGNPIRSYAAETIIMNDLDEAVFPQGHFTDSEDLKNFYHVPIIVETTE